MLGSTIMVMAWTGVYFSRHPRSTQENELLSTNNSSFDIYEIINENDTYTITVPTDYDRRRDKVKEVNIFFSPKDFCMGCSFLVLLLVYVTCFLYVSSQFVLLSSLMLHFYERLDCLAFLRSLSNIIPCFFHLFVLLFQNIFIFSHQLLDKNTSHLSLLYTSLFVLLF